MFVRLANNGCLEVTEFATGSVGPLFDGCNERRFQFWKCGFNHSRKRGVIARETPGNGAENCREQEGQPADDGDGCGCGSWNLNLPEPEAGARSRGGEPHDG